MPERLKGTLAAALIAAAFASAPSLSSQELTVRCDPPPGTLGRLSKLQKDTFIHSQDQFLAGRFGESLKELRGLMDQLPPNTPAHDVIAERAAEAAIESGDRAYARSLLKPIEGRDGSDCLAHALLARADAEDGKSADRDAEINAITALHQESADSPAGKLDVFVLEQHSLKNGGLVRIWKVLKPFGPHHTHLYAEILDAKGNTTARIELDSDDGDQVYFKEKHPELVAKGNRQYSLDAFAPDDKGGVEHATIQFYDGAPSYDTVRERILIIADRAATAPTPR